MHNKYIITYECHDNAPRMWKVVQLEKYFDFSLYSHHFSLLSLTSLLSASEREVTSPSDFKVVGALTNMVWVRARLCKLQKNGALDSQPQVIKFTLACPWSVVLSRYSGFFHHQNWSPWYSQNIAESGVKHNKSINQSFLFLLYYLKGHYLPKS